MLLLLLSIYTSEIGVYALILGWWPCHEESEFVATGCRKCIPWRLFTLGQLRSAPVWSTTTTEDAHWLVYRYQQLIYNIVLMTCRIRYCMLKTNSCKCPKSLAQYNITLASCFVVCTVIGIVICNAVAAVYIYFWNRRICTHIGMMTVPWRKWIRRKWIPEMHSLASLYPRAAPECVSMVYHRTWRVCSGSSRKRKKML